MVVMVYVNTPCGKLLYNHTIPPYATTTTTTIRSHLHVQVPRCAFDFRLQDDAVLTLKKLDLGAGTAIGTRIDLVGQSPCNKVKAFAPPGKPYKFEYTLKNSKFNVCCPGKTSLQTNKKLTHCGEQIT
jgi:hypothetical protein